MTRRMTVSEGEARADRKALLDAWALRADEEQRMLVFAAEAAGRPRLVFGVDDPPVESGIVPGYGTVEQERSSRAALIASSKGLELARALGGGK